MKPQPATGKLARVAGPLTLALGYLAAVVLPGLGALLSLHTRPFQSTPLALSFAAIAIVTLLSGPGPGIVASISTGASYIYADLTPLPPFAHDPGEILHTAIIVLLGIVVTYFCERQMVISGRLADALDTLQLKTDALIEAQQASSSVAWTYDLEHRRIEWAEGGPPIFGRPFDDPSMSDLPIILRWTTTGPRSTRPFSTRSQTEHRFRFSSAAVCRPVKFDGSRAGEHPRRDRKTSGAV